jgi:hypothetical protein
VGGFLTNFSDKDCKHKSPAWEGTLIKGATLFMYNELLSHFKGACQESEEYARQCSQKGRAENGACGYIGRPHFILNSSFGVSHELERSISRSD